MTATPKTGPRRWRRSIDSTSGARPVVREHGGLHWRTWFAILLLYSIVLVGPFLLVSAGPIQPGRGLAFEFGSASGIAALDLLAMQLVLPARLSLFRPLGADAAVRLHRSLADVLASLVAGHIVVVMVADPRRLDLLRFIGQPWRAQAAIGATAALAVLVLTSVARRRIRLSYAAWRGLHDLLAAAALALAVAHTVGVNRYLVQPPAVFALGAIGVAALGAIVLMRVPHLRRGAVAPYLVAAVQEEEGGALTLHLRADDHPGRPFSAGQFAWLRLPHLRAGLSEHPFSYSSSAADPARPAFTMRRLGGFTANAADFPPGTRLLVDGPHGAFRLTDHARGALLVAGGIGITPSISVLRTAADRGDQRPFILVYANRSPETVTFGAELARLAGVLDLRVAQVLSSPPEGWAGERGRITAELLDRILPDDLRGWQFLVCGAGGFTDAAVEALGGAGIPPERIHAERFVEV